MLAHFVGKWSIIIGICLDNISMILHSTMKLISVENVKSYNLNEGDTQL